MAPRSKKKTRTKPPSVAHNLWYYLLMAKKKQSPEDVAGQFSDDEMDQIKRYGQALGGKPSAFDEEVEEHLTGMEANAKKMRAAQTGAPEAAAAPLGPSDIDQAQVKQSDAANKQADLQAAQKAAQAQAATPPVNAPPAPSGAAGNTIPFPAQKVSVGGSGNASQPTPAAPPPQPPAPGGAPPEEGDEEDPSTQFPP